MQIFLPYPDFKQSVECLNNIHLNSQKWNCQVMAKTFTRNDRWASHPTFLAWKPYYESFKYYHDLVVDEWLKRGFRTIAVKYETPKPDKRFLPWFIGEEMFHQSHRSNLLRKDPTYASRFGWRDPDDLPYLWPNNNTYQFDCIETGIDWYKRMGWSLGKRVRKPGPNPKNREKRVQNLDNLYDKVFVKPIL